MLLQHVPLLSLCSCSSSDRSGLDPICTWLYIACFVDVSDTVVALRAQLNIATLKWKYANIVHSSVVSPEQEFSVISVVPCKGATLNDLPEMADMEVSKKKSGYPEIIQIRPF